MLNIWVINGWRLRSVSWLSPTLDKQALCRPDSPPMTFSVLLLAKMDTFNPVPDSTLLGTRFESHEAYDPNAVMDFLDVDALTGQYVRDADLLAMHADATASSDRCIAIVQRVAQLGKPR